MASPSLFQSHANRSHSRTPSSSDFGLDSQPFLENLANPGRSYAGYYKIPNKDNHGNDSDDGDAWEDIDVDTGRKPSSSQASWISNIFTSKAEFRDEIPMSYLVETERNPPSNFQSKFDRLSTEFRRKQRDVTSLLPSYTNSYSKATRDLNEYDRALWNWVNVDNLDAFLQDVYDYYCGHGIQCIIMKQIFQLLKILFVAVLSAFLWGCVDYPAIWYKRENKLVNVLIMDHCVIRHHYSIAIMLSVVILWLIVKMAVDFRKFIKIHQFYKQLLKIPDDDVQTISWNEVVRRIRLIREENAATALSNRSLRIINDTAVAKLDAQDVASRIMKQENYLVAFFNKDLLDLRTPMPGFLKRFVPEDHNKGKSLSMALEWNIRWCILGYMFDEQGRLREEFIDVTRRQELIHGLRRRFIFIGIFNFVFSPLVSGYILLCSFFRYTEEYRNDPSTIGGRRYTIYAQWKFREFNELPHLFTRRLRESHSWASKYVGQFPNNVLTLILRFVRFVFGTFAAVLLPIFVFKPEFELFWSVKVYWFLIICGALWKVVNGMIPDENTVFNPEKRMSKVITYTHYMPDEWIDNIHSKKVHEEFCELFEKKIVIFLKEITSLLSTPFVLWYSLPRCAPAIIDFVRESTVHVDGRGYVCSFAEFNFMRTRHGNVQIGARTSLPPVSNDEKMGRSILNFMTAHPDWVPNDPSLIQLRNAAEAANHSHTVHRLHDQITPLQRDLPATLNTAPRRNTGGSVNRSIAVPSEPLMAPIVSSDDLKDNVRLESVATSAVASEITEGDYVDISEGGNTSNEEHDEGDLSMDNGGILGLLSSVNRGRHWRAR